MHKQERTVREGLLWYWSPEALLNAGCGWFLPGWGDIIVAWFDSISHFFSIDKWQQLILASNRPSKFYSRNSWISLDCTSSFYVWFAKAHFSISASGRLQWSTFLKCSSTPSTFMVFIRGSNESGAEQQWQSLEAFTWRGKAWPQYDVKSQMNRSWIIQGWKFVSTNVEERHALIKGSAERENE